MIKELCTQSEKGVEVICFQSASSLQPFAYMFWIMTHWYNSAIFDSIWSKTMRSACQSNPNMTIGEVCPKIWEPAFTQCQHLLDQLHSRSMTLSNVDRHFHRYKGDLQTLERELGSLFHGVNTCRGERKDISWIHHVVTRMGEYWRLWAYREAANSFLVLRDSLELTNGDFKDVERISKEVN